MLFACNETDIYKFSDDATPQVYDSDLKSVSAKFEHNSESAIACFEVNYIMSSLDIRK